MQTLTTTQPTTTPRGQTRAFRIFEGIRSILPIAERVRQRWQKRPVAALNREQLIDQLVREHHLHCHGACGSCHHTIQDIFSD